MDKNSSLNSHFSSIKRVYNSVVDCNVALETELLNLRVALSQVESQRDALLEYLVELEV